MEHARISEFHPLKGNIVGLAVKPNQSRHQSLGLEDLKLLTSAMEEDTVAGEGWEWAMVPDSEKAVGLWCVYGVRDRRL